MPRYGDLDALSNKLEALAKRYAEKGLIEVSKEYIWACTLVDAAQTADVIDRKTHEAVCKQIMWERDVAIEQLKEIGKSFGEKMDDVAKVVRCKDCTEFMAESSICSDTGYEVGDDDFCSYGERRNDE